MCFFCWGWNRQDRSSTRDSLLIVNVSQREEALPTTVATRRIRIPVYKKVSRRQCPLIDYTWERQWTNVFNRCVSHPSEAACVSDYSGRTALHLASFNNGSPQYVAFALIRANPHALIKQDSYGQTPLHYACQFRGGTNELVALFCDKLVEYKPRMNVLNACPAVTASPLYLACTRNAPIRVIRTLVDTRQSIGTCWIAPITGGEPYEQNAGMIVHGNLKAMILLNGGECTTSPLSVMVESCKDVFGRVEIKKELQERMQTVASSVLSDQDERRVDALVSCCDENGANDMDALLSVWLKCLILLREYHVTGNEGEVSLVHLVASLKVPVPALVDCCMHVYPDEALQRDNRGHLPLHCALLNPYFSAKVFSILLQNQPQAAAMVFPNGQSPLATALEKRSLGWHDGLETLVMAHPDAIMTRDPTSGLYPFQQAASLAANVSVIFGLLRLRPDVLLII